MPDLNFNLGSVIERATKVGEKKVELRLLTLQHNVPYHEKAICVGIKGEVHGLPRPVQSITNTSLPFCSESFHVVRHVNALSHTVLIACLSSLLPQPCNFSRAMALLQCACCKNFALKAPFIVFSQGLH